MDCESMTDGTHSATASYLITAEMTASFTWCLQQKVMRINYVTHI
jgi:hypothetical protein